MSVRQSPGKENQTFGNPTSQYLFNLTLEQRAWLEEDPFV